MKGILPLVLISSTISLAETQTISYQGYALDINGSRINNEKNVTFIIYNDETDGVRVWNETKPIKFINGIYTTQLGDTNNSLVDLDFKNSIG